jgi:hypothetical protein
MATLKEYFEFDFRKGVTAGQELQVVGRNRDVKIMARVHYDLESAVKYMSYYVPLCNDPLELFLYLLREQSPEKAVPISNYAFAEMRPLGADTMNLRETRFSGRVFIYSENNLSEQELITLKEFATHQGLSVQFRGPNYSKERNAHEKPLAFISHDSRDKKRIARPLALELRKKGCPVWYDEFSLKVGDNLRESIERGVKESKNCILILTPRFLANTGWTKVEFESVFAKQIIEKSNVLLPVWDRVTEQQIYQYCPSLLNTVGVRWSLGRVEVSQRLYSVIMSSLREWLSLELNERAGQQRYDRRGKSG